MKKSLFLLVLISIASNSFAGVLRIWDKDQDIDGTKRQYLSIKLDKDYFVVSSCEVDVRYLDSNYKSTKIPASCSEKYKDNYFDREHFNQSVMNYADISLGKNYLGAAAGASGTLATGAFTGVSALLTYAALSNPLTAIGGAILGAPAISVGAFMTANLAKDTAFYATADRKMSKAQLDAILTNLDNNPSSLNNISVNDFKNFSNSFLGVLNKL